MIHYTTAHYSQLVGTLKVLLLVIISLIVFGVSVTWFNIVGMCLSLIGFLLYNYFQYLETKKRRELERFQQFTIETDNIISESMKKKINIYDEIE